MHAAERPVLVWGGARHAAVQLMLSVEHGCATCARTRPVNLERLAHAGGATQMWVRCGIVWGRTTRRGRERGATPGRDGCAPRRAHPSRPGVAPRSRPRLVVRPHTMPHRTHIWVAPPAWASLSRLTGRVRAQVAHPCSTDSIRWTAACRAPPQTKTGRSAACMTEPGEDRGC